MSLPLLRVGGSAAGSFNPADISGLQAFWDTSSGMFQEINSPTTPATANGNPVGTWVPIVGPNTSCMLNNRRPTRQTVSGKIRLQYDGTDDFLQVDDAAFNATFAGTDKPFTVAVIFQLLATPASQNIWAFCSTANPNPFCFININSTPAYTKRRRNDAGANNQSTAGTADLLQHVSITTLDGVTLRHYIDDVEVGTGLTITSSVCTFNRLSMGALGRGTPGDFANFYQGSMCVYNRAITAGERTQLNTYLSAL